MQGVSKFFHPGFGFYQYCQFCFLFFIRTNKFVYRRPYTVVRIPYFVTGLPVGRFTG